MGMDKQSSKSSGYVGGFFQLFDWKAKSRKKLFSSKLESPEHSKQGKRSEGNLPMTRLYLMDDDEARMDYACCSNEGFSCASSVTDDDGSGNRGPSVVARLMGLDSLPMSISSDPYLTTFSDNQSLQESHSYQRNLDYPHNHQVMYSRNFTSKMEGSVRHTVEEKPPIQRPTSRPIEKFQTEVLPPKSAKSIPITQHRLLSPIKSPGFIPSRDPAHIMEAAVKILDPGHHPITKGKIPTLMPSSVNGRIRDGTYKEEQPSHVLLRVQDIKEKIDAAQRTTSKLAEASERSLGANASKYLKGHSLKKSWNGLETSLFCASSDKEEAYSSSRNKGKSVSLAVQAKSNVQKRGGMSVSERSLVSQMETSESNLGESFRSQSRASKNQLKRLPVSNSSGVLRQNNQKQNCAVDKEKPPSESSLPKLQARKALPADSPARPKTSNRSVGGSRVGSRRLEAMGNEKESTPSSTKHIPRKKRSIEGELQLNKIHVRDDVSGDKSKKRVQSISKPNKLSTWAEDSRKNGMDVVSFTFTAPLGRTLPGSDTSGQLTQKSSNCLGKRAYSQADNMRWPTSNNVLGDALSMLLEQKLRELSNEVGSSCHDSLSGQSSSSSASPFQDTMSTHTATNTMQKSQDSYISWPSRCSFGSDFNNGCFTTNAVPFKFSNGIQGFDEERCDNKAKQLDFRHPSPSSVLEQPFSAESCFSSESINSNFMEGNWRSLAQANEIVGMSLQKKPHLLEADVDLSDSASSLLTPGAITRRHHTPTGIANSPSKNNWEIYYVKDILSNIELMFKDFTLGRAREIINPHLFEQLEGRKDFTKSGSADSRLTRKVLFDYVSECMDSRCKNFVDGGCRSWAKGLSLVKRKEWLAEDIYKEIRDWRSLGDSMVDDLVDKDMRSPYGRWMDFDVDAFELGLEMERDILDSLVDEAIAPLLK